MRKHVKAIEDACRAGDAERFYQLTYLYDWPYSFWASTFRMIVKKFPKGVTPAVQVAFRDSWVETKMIGLNCDDPADHGAMCQALRILTPAYRGPELRLYRGASSLEREREEYGVSWGSSLSAAEEFAQTYRVRHDGSVVLETVAPPAAIISAIEYPPPITDVKRAALPPGTKVIERHEECEYLVDRRLLGIVTVVHRFSQLSAAGYRAHLRAREEQ